MKSSKAKRIQISDDPTEATSTDVNMASTASLLEEHQKALCAEFKTTIVALETKLDHRTGPEDCLA